MTHQVAQISVEDCHLAGVSACHAKSGHNTMPGLNRHGPATLAYVNLLKSAAVGFTIEPCKPLYATQPDKRLCLPVNLQLLFIRTGSLLYAMAAGG